MTLQQALVTLTDDLYYKIWDMYLSLETVGAKERCKEDILNWMRSEASSIFIPHKGSTSHHLFLLDAAMHLCYPFGLVLTNVTMPIGNCNVCLALGNIGYRCKTCEQGVYGTICFTDYSHTSQRSMHEPNPW